MQAATLSEGALALLKRRAVRERVEVTPETLPAYRELVAAGIMIPLATFTRGQEGAFRFTEAGWDRREEWINGLGSPPPSGGGSPEPRG